MSTSQDKRRGRPALLQTQRIEALKVLVKQMPHACLEELTRELVARTGVNVRPATVRQAFKRAGIKRLKPERRPGTRAAVQGATPQRHGYTHAHRRIDGANGYSTDLTDAEWEQVALLFECEGRRGVPAKHSRRQMVDSCIYIVRTGCAWRLLPKEFPPWRAVYSSFRRWARAGTFEAMHDLLRQRWRERIGRTPDPSAAIIDSQSTRSSAQGGDTGIDAGKKVKGRKRHLVVDTLGLVLPVTVTAASVRDPAAADAVVAAAFAKVPGLSRLYADSTYASKCKQRLEDAHAISVDIVRRPHNRVTGTLIVGEQQPEYLGYTL